MEGFAESGVVKVKSPVSYTGYRVKRIHLGLGYVQVFLYTAVTAMILYVAVGGPQQSGLSLPFSFLLGMSVFPLLRGGFLNGLGLGCRVCYNILLAPQCEDTCRCLASVFAAAACSYHRCILQPELADQRRDLLQVRYLMGYLMVPSFCC